MSGIASNFYTLLISPRETLSDMDDAFGPAALYFSIGAAVTALSFAITAGIPLHPVAVLAVIIAALPLLFISAIIKTGLIALFSAAGTKYRKGRTARSFITAVLSLQALSVYLLPAALACSFLRITPFFPVVYFGLGVLTFICTARIVSGHFTFRSMIGAYAAAAVPACIDAVMFIALFVLTAALGGSLAGFRG